MSRSSSRALLSAALLACPLLAGAADFTLSSPDIRAGQPMSQQHEFNGFGCQGANLSPALEWRGAPAGTKSFAVTVFDPDAPTGSGWWHWVVVNLPATTTALPQGAGSAGPGALPAGALQTRTDFGSPGFGGACPPVGDKAHRYVFTVHALKVDRLDLPADASGALVGFNLHANSLGRASLTASYRR
ncbi:MAG: kinase inhibitor [Burkholderiaceae bacterium]